MRQNKRSRVPRIDEVRHRISSYLEAKEWLLLEEYMELLYSTLMLHAQRCAFRLQHARHCIYAGYYNLALHYERQAQEARATLPVDTIKESEYLHRLKRLEDQSLLLMKIMEWCDEMQELSYELGEIYQKLGDLDATERHFQNAVARYDFYPVRSGLEGLGDVWRLRGDWMTAAFFFRWAVDAHLLPAEPYVHLYCCLIRSGQREKVVSEMEAYERKEPKSMRDLMALAAGKQVLGFRAEANALWARSIEEMRKHPRYDPRMLWEQSVELAQAIKCEEAGESTS